MAKRNAYEEWRASLPAAPTSSRPPARALADPEYSDWASTLPASSARLAAGEPEPVPDPVPPEVPRRYGLVQAFDGEAPILQLFTTPEALVKKAAELEGGDVYVVPFVGAVIAVSAGPARHFRLPDGRVLRAGCAPGDPPAFVDDWPAGLAAQEDGFLGPPDYLVPPPADPGAEPDPGAAYDDPYGDDGGDDDGDDD